MRTLAGAPFVLVAEAWNVKTGLGSRFGSYLLQAGFKAVQPHRHAPGGQRRAVATDGLSGLDSDGILGAISALV